MIVEVLIMRLVRDVNSMSEKKFARELVGGLAKRALAFMASALQVANEKAGTWGIQTIFEVHISL